MFRCGAILRSIGVFGVGFLIRNGWGMHLNVLLTGRLKGMGREAGCELMAKRSPSRMAEQFTYSEPVVIQAPADLPEGSYTLHFENYSMPVMHKGVLWLVNTPPPADAEAGKPAVGASMRGEGRVGRARRLIRDRRGNASRR